MLLFMQTNTEPGKWNSGDKHGNVTSPFYGRLGKVSPGITPELNPKHHPVSLIDKEGSCLVISTKVRYYI